MLYFNKIFYLANNQLEVLSQQDTSLMLTIQNVSSVMSITCVFILLMYMVDVGQVNRGAACCGNGRKDDEGQCICNDKFSGSNCEFLEEGFKYVCSPECKNGMVAADGTCVCDDGFDGFHCDHLACKHGKWGCPRDYCSSDEMSCICEHGYEGARCDEECHELMCVKGQGVWDKASCSCDCIGPWGGRLCDVCASTECPDGLVQDPDTCACNCPSDDAKVKMKIYGYSCVYLPYLFSLNVL
jgi:hypothetical protein